MQFPAFYIYTKCYSRILPFVFFQPAILLSSTFRISVFPPIFSAVESGPSGPSFSYSSPDLLVWLLNTQSHDTPHPSSLVKPSFQGPNILSRFSLLRRDGSLRALYLYDSLLYHHLTLLPWRRKQHTPPKLRNHLPDYTASHLRMQ
jgi:hypothetical protein